MISASFPSPGKWLTQKPRKINFRDLTNTNNMSTEIRNSKLENTQRQYIQIPCNKSIHTSVPRWIRHQDAASHRLQLLCLWVESSCWFRKTQCDILPQAALSRLELSSWVLFASSSASSEPSSLVPSLSSLRVSFLILEVFDLILKFSGVIQLDLAYLTLVIDGVFLIIFGLLDIAIGESNLIIQFQFFSRNHRNCRSHQEERPPDWLLRRCLLLQHHPLGQRLRGKRVPDVWSHSEPERVPHHPLQRALHGPQFLLVPLPLLLLGGDQQGEEGRWRPGLHLLLQDRGLRDRFCSVTLPAVSQ